MRITISSGGPSALEEWRGYFRELDPSIEVVAWDAAPTDAAGIGYALVWAPDAGRLASLPDLKLIISAGVGVDGILADPQLPDVPIARMVTGNTAGVMSDYVLTAALMLMRESRRMAVNQAARRWEQLENPPLTSEVRVGIMGLGQLGAHAAQRLAQVGFQVSGWSRTRADLPGVRCHAGPDELAGFLAETQILVCLLPATDATRGILNQQLFAALPRGASVINVGRGAHLVEADLLQALDSGHLKGAVLDVFEVEPLPVSSPLWDHPAITITPHYGSTPTRQERARRAVEMMHQWERGEMPDSLFDRSKGY